jgi:hypothetical protein
MLKHQSQADPCVFFKKDEQGRIVLIAAVHVDNTVILGTHTKIDEYKLLIKKCFGYTDLGPLEKYLRVWYDEKRDENVKRYLVTTVLQHLKGIIANYEGHIGEEAK